MSQPKPAPPPDGSTSPKAWYQAARAMPGFVHDAAQDAMIEELDKLWQQLIEFKSKRNQFLGRSLLRPSVPKGLYLWGGVGRGKTFLMDGFYACLPYRRKRRLHFHHFMAEVHQHMKMLAGRPDPLLALADNIAESTRLLCLDEFHVDDIADAMILGRLVAALFERGVVLITTSNYPPDDLYPNGLQRQNFLPAIELLKRELKVLNLDSGRDYRLRTMTREPLFIVAGDAASDAAAEVRMQELFELIAGTTARQDASVVILNRTVPVKQISRSSIWFEFAELCGGAHDQSDYLEIARRYPTLFLSHIPQITAEHAAAAKRFTWLVDVLYDNSVRLVASAAASLDRLVADEMASGEISRTLSRLNEMQSQRYLQQLHATQHMALNNAASSPSNRRLPGV